MKNKTTKTPATSAALPYPKKKRLTFTRDDMELTMLALPTFVWYVIFMYLPMFGIIIPFKQYRIDGNGFISSLLSSEWVGFENFKFLFATDNTWIMIRNTVLYNIAFITLGIIVPVIFAILMNEMLWRKFAKTCQTMMFLPYFLSWVVISYFVYAFLSPDKGLVNSMLVAMGFDKISWYTSPQYWPFILIFLNTWKFMGYNSVIYMASIAGFDKSMYEAALIDGASKWQQVKYITLPLLKPIMIILFIMNIGNIFRSDIGIFWHVPKAQGALRSVTETVDTYLYRAMTQINDIGKSSAVNFVQSVIGCITILVANGIVTKVDPDSAMF